MRIHLFPALIEWVWGRTTTICFSSRVTSWGTCSTCCSASIMDWSWSWEWTEPGILGGLRLVGCLSLAWNWGCVGGRWLVCCVGDMATQRVSVIAKTWIGSLVGI